MFNLLKLTAQALLKAHEVTDENSFRAFLRELILFVRSHAAGTKIPLDNVLLKRIEFIVKDDALFAYTYRLIFEQLQTPEILFESANEETIVELVENNEQIPEKINPALIVALVTKIISFMRRQRS